MAVRQHLKRYVGFAGGVLHGGEHAPLARLTNHDHFGLQPSQRLRESLLKR